MPFIGLYEKALPSSLKITEKLQIAKQSGFDYIEISIDESDEYLAKLDWPIITRRELTSQSQELNLPIVQSLHERASQISVRQRRSRLANESARYAGKSY